MKLTRWNQRESRTVERVRDCDTTIMLTPTKAKIVATVVVGPMPVAGRSGVGVGIVGVDGETPVGTVDVGG